MPGKRKALKTPRKFLKVPFISVKRTITDTLKRKKEPLRRTDALMTEANLQAQLRIKTLRKKTISVMIPLLAKQKMILMVLLLILHLTPTVILPSLLMPPTHPHLV